MANSTLTNTYVEKLINDFIQQFHSKPEYIIRSPGRVNIIGEHTDYNDGLVLPMAIEPSILMAITPRSDTLVQLHSLDFQQTKLLQLPVLKIDTEPGWIKYIQAVALALQAQGRHLTGFNACIHSNLPCGAGLSSSAALALAIAKAFSLTSNFSWQPREIALLAQQAENTYVGVNCGIMDQMAIACAQKNHAVFIDCRNIACKMIPLPATAVFVIMDTTTRRGLVESAYNQRRSQCETAANVLGITVLRDATLEQLKQNKHQLSDVVYQRAQHVISENERVCAAVTAMEKNDMRGLGILLNQSHTSLHDNFAVTNKALNIIVSCAQASSGCFGARMTGAGFGGCAVALVQQDKVALFIQQVAQAYQSATNLKAKFFTTCATNGTSIINK